MRSTLASDGGEESAAEHMMLAVLIWGVNACDDTVTVWNGPDEGLTRLLIPLLAIYDASPRSRHRIREHISAATA